MEPTATTYFLRDELNTERFKRLLSKKGYDLSQNARGCYHFLENQEEVLEINRAKTEGILINNTLYVFPLPGKFSLDQLAREFQLE